MQTVQNLQSALARFSPDARLSVELDVQGPSPATDCIITAEMSDDDKQKMDDLDEANDELQDEVGDYENLLKEIKIIVKEMPEGHVYKEKLESAIGDADV